MNESAIKYTIVIKQGRIVCPSEINTVNCLSIIVTKKEAKKIVELGLPVQSIMASIPVWIPPFFRPMYVIFQRVNRGCFSCTLETLQFVSFSKLLNKK